MIDKKIEKQLNDINKEIAQKVGEYNEKKSSKIAGYHDIINELETRKAELLEKREELLTTDTSAVIDIDEQTDAIDKKISVNREALATCERGAFKETLIDEKEKEIKSLLRDANEKAYNEVVEHIKESLLIYKDLVELISKGNKTIKDIERSRQHSDYIKHCYSTNIGNSDISISNLLGGLPDRTLNAEKLAISVLGKPFREISSELN